MAQVKKIPWDERINYIVENSPLDLPGVTKEEMKKMVETVTRVREFTYRSLSRLREDPRAMALLKDEGIARIVKGSIDIHCHGGAEPIARRALETEIGVEYTKIGMKAVVIKTHYFPSAMSTMVAQHSVDQWAKEQGMEPTKMLGGIVLSKTLGGFNAEAVRWASKFPTCSHVWMPSLDSIDQDIIVFGEDRGGLSPLDEKGNIRSDVKEIFKIVADRNLVLATGHYTHKYRKKIIEEAIACGVKKIEVQHCNLGGGHPASATIDMMKEYVKMGKKADVRLKLGMIALVITSGIDPPVEGNEYLFKAVKEVGPEHFVLGTDYGQIHNHPHSVGILGFARHAIANGLTEEEISKVMKDNATELLSEHLT